MATWRMIAKSTLKKYKKLNNYAAIAHSSYSFKRHLSIKFQISQFELDRAIRTNKIIIVVDLVSPDPEVNML
jgi:hypothetical protein